MQLIIFYPEYVLLKKVSLLFPFCYYKENHKSSSVPSILCKYTNPFSSFSSRNIAMDNKNGTLRTCQELSRAVRSQQGLSGLVSSHQDPSTAVRTLKQPPAAIRNRQEPSAAIRTLHQQSGPVSSRQDQSRNVRTHPEQSIAVKTLQ